MRDFSRHSPHGLIWPRRRVQRSDFPNQGRGDEGCRVMSCLALGLDPADPLAFLRRPWVRFAAAVAACALAAVLIVVRAA